MNSILHAVRRILALSLLLLSISATNTIGQITIADPAFAAWLQTNYPTAMTGNVLDDQDPSVLATTTLAIPNLGISDFTGIEAFVNINGLYINGNDLSTFVLPNYPNQFAFTLENFSGTDFPALTPNVASVGCTVCLNLTSIPALPSGVTTFHLDLCPAIQILPAVPAGLMQFYLNGCPSVIGIPPLPSALQWLTLDATPAILTLPLLPPNISYFSCKGNGLSAVAPLPLSLNLLDCSNNNISCLPDLPANLQTLYAAGNPVNCLPNLPANLTSDIGTDLCNGLTLTSVINTSCFSSCDGELNVSFSPGNYGYTIFPIGISGVISSGDTVLAIDSLCFVNGGTFQLQNAGIGCNSRITFTIVQPVPINTTLTTHTNVTCNAGNDGTITADAQNGVPPYLYSLDGGITTQSSPLFTNLDTGMYDVTVIDSNGCIGTAHIIITQPPNPVVSLGPDVITCPLMNVNLCALQPAITYSWSNGTTTQCISVSAGVYTVTVTDLNGCTGTDDIEIITSNPSFGLSVQSITLPDCGQCNGGATIVADSASGPLTYLWTPGFNTAPSWNFICADSIYNVLVTDTNGCYDSISLSLSCNEVWPGDANYDGVADNNDLLAIGVGYGETGTPRINATINWQPQSGVDWTDTLPGNINYKHIDCNGDGIIADDDTTAIIQNFGLNHPLRMQNTTGPNDPALFFDITVDTSGTSAQLSVPLHLGTAAVPAVDIYGVAFTVNYDTSLVKADSVSMDFANCWITGTGHSLSIAVNDPLNGRLYAAITRTDHTDTTGFGEIGTFGIVTVDNISARLSGITSDTLILSLSNVQLIMHTGEEKLVNIGSDTLIINDNTVGLYKNTDEGNISVYPNPAGNYFIVNAQQQLNNVDVRIYNLLNEEVKVNYKSNGNTLIVNSSHLKSGLYIVNIKSDDGSFTFKLNKAQ